MIRLIVSEPSLLLKKKLNEYTLEAIEEKDDFNYCVFDFEENPIDEIIECLESPAFGSEKKVVICKNPYFISNEKVKLPFENDLEKFEKYLYNENKDSILIVVCPQKYFNSKSKHVTIFSNIGSYENLLFEQPEEFIEYGNFLINNTKINITGSAKVILFERCMSDVCKLEREIAKLSLFPDKIDDDDIKKLVSKPLEDNVFDLTKALLEKNRKRTMQIYTDLKLLKVEPIVLVSLLAGQFRLLLQTSILMKKGYRESDIAKELSVHPFRIKKSIEALQKYKLDDIKQILIDLSTLDSEIKAGIRDRYVDFEIFLASK